MSGTLWLPDKTQLLCKASYKVFISLQTSTHMPHLSLPEQAALFLTACVGSLLKGPLQAPVSHLSRHIMPSYPFEIELKCHLSNLSVTR